MRCYLFVVCCFIGYGLMSCNKTLDKTATVNGSWELRSWEGGKSIVNSGEREPGNGTVYTFVNDHFEHYEDHILRDSGTYRIIKSAGPENEVPLDAFLFNETDTHVFIISNDTLTLDPRAPHYDGIAQNYVRIDQH